MDGLSRAPWHVGMGGSGRVRFLILYMIVCLRMGCVYVANSASMGSIQGHHGGCPRAILKRGALRPRLAGTSFEESRNTWIPMECSDPWVAFSLYNSDDSVRSWCYNTCDRRRRNSSPLEKISALLSWTGMPGMAMGWLSSVSSSLVCGLLS